MCPSNLQKASKDQPGTKHTPAPRASSTALCSLASNLPLLSWHSFLALLFPWSILLLRVVTEFGYYLGISDRSNSRHLQSSSVSPDSVLKSMLQWESLVWVREPLSTWGMRPWLSESAVVIPASSLRGAALSTREWDTGKACSTLWLGHVPW